jgi:tRNA(fMet)-specific endonuclease VapC
MTMPFLLDTNACIRILKNSSPPLVARLRDRDPNEIFLCSVVKAELIYGAYRSARQADNLRQLDHFFQPFVSVPFDDNCTEVYGRIRHQLERAGQVIGPYDLMIAAIALANDLVLITHNTREFSRVVGLRFEDWEIP